MLKSLSRSQIRVQVRFQSPDSVAVELRFAAGGTKGGWFRINCERFDHAYLPTLGCSIHQLSCRLLVVRFTNSKVFSCSNCITSVLVRIINCRRMCVIKDHLPLVHTTSYQVPTITHKTKVLVLVFAFFGMFSTGVLRDWQVASKEQISLLWLPGAYLS